MQRWSAVGQTHALRRAGWAALLAWGMTAGVVTAAAPAMPDRNGAPAPEAKGGPFRKHWWERLKPAKPAPEDQLAYAQRLKDAGRYRKAGKQFRALVYRWPQASEAALAQFNYADCLEHRRKWLKAFDEYQYLLETYAGFCSFDDVMQREYGLADRLATRTRHFLFFKYRTPEEAVPLFETLIRNGPQWPRCSELQFRVGDIHERNKDYDLAIEAYRAYQFMYPSGPRGEQAAYHLALCAYRLSRQTPYDADLRDSAVAACRSFFDRYPRSEQGGAVTTYLQELQLDQAAALYWQARDYDRAARFTRDRKQIATRLTAAKLVYQRLLDEFPSSRWTDTARARIAQINGQLEPAL